MRWCDGAPYGPRKRRQRGSNDRIAARGGLDLVVSGALRVADELHQLTPLYEQGAREVPTTPSIDLGKVWRPLLSSADRGQAFRAFEVATLLALRRALRNGTVWIDHSLAFRS